MRKLIALAVALAAVGGPTVVAAQSRQHRPTYFVFEQPNKYLLEAVRKNVEDKISYNNVFSVAYVDCGVACGSYWFVDRTNGAIIMAPDESGDYQIVYTVVTQRNSSTVRVIYGPSDGIGDNCFYQNFDIKGYVFKHTSDQIPTDCPG